MSLLSRFVRPSTRAFWQASMHAAGPGRSRLLETLHGYVYLRWTTLYINVGLGRGRAARLLQAPAAFLGRVLGLWGRGAAKNFADSYHGKTMPPGTTAGRLIAVGRPLAMDVPERVLPYAEARALVLEQPEHIGLYECPCRAGLPKSCKPLDVCVIVGKIFVDFLAEHKPDKIRRVSPEEALAVIEAEQKRGHASHAFFKEAMLGRFYAICNCCRCCCGAIRAHLGGTPMLASSGHVCRTDHERCLGCGLCAARCPFRAISMREEGPGGRSRPDGETPDATSDAGPDATSHAGPDATSHAGPDATSDAGPAGGRKSDRRPHVRSAACLGCGVCALLCPQGALRLERDPERPAPLEIPPPPGAVMPGAVISDAAMPDAVRADAAITGAARADAAITAQGPFGSTPGPMP